MNRLTLREILLVGLENIVHFGKSLVRIEQKDGSVCVQFADGTRDTGDLLVGADGAHWGRPNSRVTSRHLSQSSGIRAFMSSSKRPYGFTCSQISGVRARRSLAVSFSGHCGRASTCCSMSVLM